MLKGVGFEDSATGIYEGLSVKPGGADFVEQKFFCNILVAFGIGRSALF
jgi:hypothetical protein